MEPARRGAHMDIFYLIVLLVFGTALPLTLDLARTFLPPSLRTGRLVASWHRPVLIAMVCCLCVWAVGPPQRKRPPTQCQHRLGSAAANGKHRPKKPGTRERGCFRRAR